jgi:hypothetical protein
LRGGNKKVILSGSQCCADKQFDQSIISDKKCQR